MKLYVFFPFILSIAVAGLLFAGFASSDEDGSYAEDEYEWEMFSNQVSGGKTGDKAIHSHVFIYNKRTGEVYRFMTNVWTCGNEAFDGCFVPVSGNQ